MPQPIPTDAGPSRVFLLDDHQMFSASLVRVLNEKPDLEVVGTAATIDEAAARAPVARPDVVIVDFLLPDGGGPQVIEAPRIAVPTAKVLVLTALDDEQALAAALAAGCDGFVSTDQPPEELLDAHSRLEAVAIAVRRELAPRRAVPPADAGQGLTRSVSAGRSGSTAGTSTVTVVPAPSADSMRTVPPRAHTIPQAVEKPRPVPCEPALVLKNGSNACSATSTGIPGPLSATPNARYRPGSSSPFASDSTVVTDIVISTVPPSGIAARKLSNKFTSTWSTNPRGARTRSGVTSAAYTTSTVSSRDWAIRVSTSWMIPSRSSGSPVVGARRAAADA